MLKTGRFYSLFIGFPTGFQPKTEQKRGTLTAAIPEFEADDLRRAAFFMATGSGKTLLLHAHVQQVLS